MSAQEQKGFTLVELLVVISIIAILSVIGITVFSGVQKGARDAKRKEDFHAISLAIQQYYYANNRMPINRTPCCGYPQTSPNFLQELVDGGFMREIPKDPSYPNDFYYYYDYGPGSAAGAILVTNLETISNTTSLPGSCRPFTNNWCSSTTPSKNYCICNPY